MYVYIGFDDTDTVDADRGTGKLARWFEKELPPECRLWGVVRQQLLLDEAIPYSSHNSSACAVVECSDSFPLDILITKAIHHIETYFIEGSDPGLCLFPEGHAASDRLISFGLSCATKIVSQKEAIQAANGVHLSGHGGTNDGIIGAVAAVGLTAHGWYGRFIEFGRLREFPATIPVSTLVQSGIQVVSIDRDAQIPAQNDLVETSGWLRPLLWGGKPIIPVIPKGKNLWETVGKKRGKEKKEGWSHGRENFLQGTDKGWGRQKTTAV
jgi:hypothetical protein